MALAKLKLSRTGWTTTLSLVALQVLIPFAADAATHLSPKPPADYSWLGKLTPGLRGNLARVDGDLNLIVTFRTGEPTGAAGGAAAGGHAFVKETTDSLASDLAPIGLAVTRSFTRLPMAAVRVPARYLDILASDPRIATVELDLPVHALRTKGEATLNVPPVTALGITGAGVSVAVIDTGVDYRHDELKPGGTDASAKTILLWDAIDNDADPMDMEGHGTSVAGVIAGVGIAPTTFNPTPSKGVAPGARIVAVRVLNAQGSSENGSVQAGVDKVVDSVLNGNPYNIRAVNLSLGGLDETLWPPNEGTCDELVPSYKMAFDTLTDAGVLVLAAAGNDACSTGVGYPACVSSAMAVGAVYNTRAPSRRFLTTCGSGGECADAPAEIKAITCYSNSGTKLAAWAPADGTETAKKTSATNTAPLEYGFGGTSCATPYLAGVAALLFQVNPAASPLAVQNAMVTTGTPITDVRNGVTRNLVDAAAARTTLLAGCATPAAPAQIAVDGRVCESHFTVNWSAVAGAASYSLEVSDTADFASFQSFIGSATSITLENDTPYPQTLYFRVRANSACASSTWTSTVSSCAVQQSYSQVISGIARKAGYAPAVWYSDLAVLNPGSSDTTLTLTFHGATATPTVTASLPAHQQKSWTNIVQGLFGVTAEDAGAVTLTSTAPVLAVARTYSQVSSGQPTYGQEYPGSDPATGLTQGEVAYLPNLRSDGNYYTNIEIVNMGTAAAVVEARYFANTGTSLGTMSWNVLPGQRASKGKVLPTGQPGAFAEVRTSTAGARVLALASVVDNVSKDPTTIPMFVNRASSGAHSYFISGIAQTPGFAPAYWYSDTAFLNPTDSTESLTLTFTSATRTLTQARQLPGKQQITFANVLQSLFGLSAADKDTGALKVAGSGPTVAMARTYSQSSPSDPTFGQGYVGLENADGLVFGKVGFIPGLRNDSPYYTNLEAVNVGSVATDVEWRLYDNTGTLLASVTKNVAPGMRASASKVLPTGSTTAFAEVRVSSDGARVIAFASVIDNLSKDPTTIGMVVPQ